MIRKLTREEYQSEFGTEPRISGAQPEVPQDKGNFLTGLAKSGLSTVKGTLKLGEKAANFLMPKAIEPGDFVADMEKTKLGQKYFTDEALKTRGTGEKVGKFVGDVAQFAIPGTKVAKATQALSTIPRIASRAVVAGGIGAAQTGDLKQGAVAAGLEAVAPGAAKVAGVVAKPVSRFMGRLFKGVGSGLSGASSQQIEAVLKNPQAAKQVVGEIKKKGGAAVLRKNAETIVQGVSKIRQDARKAFGEGLENLSEADIKPEVFRQHTKVLLDKYGVFKTGGKRVLGNVEFDDPKNIAKASELINKLSRAKLDGKSLRKLADDIESSTYKIATSDERLAYNAFAKDLSGTLKQAISKSTDKLDDINKAFSGDMQLVEEIEKIFGKVKFKNAREILTVSQKLENLFSQKGLAPEATDKFLQKLGLEPTGFRASEAVRQMGELAPTANTIGTNPFEIVRAFTSAIVPPEMVRNIAIATGLGQDFIREVATKLSPTARAIFIKLILGNPTPEPENTNEKQ